MCALQRNIDEKICRVLRGYATAIRDSITTGTPPDLWFTVQIHSWTDVREPANDEIRAMVNLGLCYGVKGIMYYAIHGDSNITVEGQPSKFRGLLEQGDTAVWDPGQHTSTRATTARRRNPYDEDKYAGITAINAKLAALGPTLMTLQWRDAFARHSIETGPPTLFPITPKFALIDSIKVIDAISADSTGALDDSAYVQVAWLQNSSNVDHLFLVNRRTTPGGSRTVGLRFDGSQSQVSHMAAHDVYSGCIDVLRVRDTLAALLAPGDAVLWWLEPALWNAQVSTDTTIAVHEGAVLEMLRGSSLTINGNSVVTVGGAVAPGRPGGRLVIEDSATVIVRDSAQIILKGGEIVFAGQGSGRLILEHKDALHGWGRLVNASISLPDTFVISSQDTLLFTGGGRFLCNDTVTTQRLHVQGELLFDAGSAGSLYRFPDCLKTICITPGAVRADSGVTLRNVPDVLVWDGGALRASGRPGDTCYFQFRTMTGCDVYSSIDASHTVFEHNPETAGAWKGLLVAYEDSRMGLDTCTFTGINSEDGMGGAAIHLYASVSQDNHIKGCRISRQPGDEENMGVGVFLQSDPSGTLRSYVRISCSEIGREWSTAAAAINSMLEINTSQIEGNRIGASFDYGADGMIYGTRIVNHANGTGVYIRDANVLLGDPFGYVTPTPGNNVFMENDSVQIAVDTAGWVCGGGGGQDLGSNVFTHSDIGVPRLWMSPAATYSELCDDWWGVSDSSGIEGCLMTEATQRTLLDLPAGSSPFLYWQPVICSEPSISTGPLCTEEDEGIDPVLPHLPKRRNLPPQASSLFELPFYAAEGLYHEVYRYLGSFLSGGCTTAQALAIAAYAVRLEQLHVRRYPDSTDRCRERCSQFLHAAYQSATQAERRAGLLAQRASALWSFGDAEGARSCIDLLRANWPGSGAARGVLPLLACMSATRSDTAALNAVIGDMIAAGCGAQMQRDAQALKRGALRVIPRAVRPKMRASGEPEEGAAASPLAARSYPNPFGLSTVIEYTLPERDDVTVTILAPTGRLLARLSGETQEAGRHSVVFQPREALPPGMYLYVIRTSTLQASGKVLLRR
jgi:hypothetical protein